MTTDDARRTREVKSVITMTEAALSKYRILYTNRLDIKFNEETCRVLNVEHSFVR